MASLPLRYFRSFLAPSAALASRAHSLRSLACAEPHGGVLLCRFYSAWLAKMSGIGAVFELGAETVESPVPATPDRGDPRDRVAQGLGPDVEAHLPARALAFDQSGLGQQLQVLHHGLAADCQRRRELGRGGRRTPGQLTEERTPGGIGECGEHGRRVVATLGAHGSLRSRSRRLRPAELCSVRTVLMARSAPAPGGFARRSSAPSARWVLMRGRPPTGKRPAPGADRPAGSRRRGPGARSPGPRAAGPARRPAPPRGRGPAALRRRRRPRPPDRARS